MAPVEKVLSEKTENVPDNTAPVKEAAPEAVIKEPFLTYSMQQCKLFHRGRGLEVRGTLILGKPTRD